MKDSTKELFDRLQHSCLYEDESEVRKLKELCLKVEYYVQHGGFIADYYGCLCKEGDVILVNNKTSNNPYKSDEAILMWNKKARSFMYEDLKTKQRFYLEAQTIVLLAKKEEVNNELLL